MSLATLILNFLSLAFLLVSFVYLIKKRKREDNELESAANIFVFGLFILVIGLLINFMTDWRETYGVLLLPADSVTALTQALNIGIMPLAAICFLVAIMVFKENIKN